MKFTEIDFDSWPRREVFYYFSKMAPTGYSLTVDVDVTDLVQKLKSINRKFFPTYLWLVTKCVNKQIEFKVAYQTEKLGYYDVLTPLYATFHDDDKTISLMWTEFDEDYEVFYQRYVENQQKYANKHGILSQTPLLPPANAYTVSSLPWVSFKHLSVNSFENKQYYFPSIESGKYYETKEGKKLLPLSITCHHATTDGYHVSKFLEDLKEEMEIMIKKY